MPDMDRSFAGLRVVAVLGLLAFGTASAASADTLVAVETPQNQTAAPQPFIIKGWALDTAATANPGIAEVQVWAYPDPGSGAPGIFVGTATYGGSRPQVGQQRGAQFTNSGYELTVRGLAPKTYLFAVFARSSISNTWGLQPGTVTLQVQATPIMHTSTPNPLLVSHVAQPFTVGGFAIDLASATGSGVAGVYVVAYPTTPGATPIPIGEATYGISVPEVGTFFGDERFAASGFQVSVSGLPPGQYSLVSFAYSTVAAAFNNASGVLADVDTPVPAPVISLPSGTYPTPQSVTISIPLDAAVHITRDGTTPTATSESYSGGVLTVSENTSLRARAFRAGWAPSPTVAAEYTIVAVAPTILTAAGQYEAPISVQISVPDGAVVRITRDGSVPTSTSEAYAGPFEIAQNTQLRAVAFKAGMAPSLTAAADYTFAAAMPTFSPSAGTYTGPISIALTSATPGASLYWTIDGSDPSTSSNQYVTPISIAAGPTKTVKARAFRDGWVASAVATATYTFEMTGPVSISAQISPAPNTAGWNNTNVTVNFTCTNASSCPVPISVTGEGVAQVVSGTASNATNSASVTVSVNIDRTPPVLSLASPLPTPANGSLPLTGSLSDSLSGVDTVTCNGMPGTSVSGTASCAVAVRYGTNSIVMQATDVAGNASSRGSQVYVAGVPSHLAILPSRRTLAIGETVLLQTVDDGGLPPASATWSSSDTAVASITDGAVTALGVGTATITLVSGSLSAEATIDVLPAGPLPVGAVRWSVTSPPDYGAADTVVVRGDDTTSFVRVEERWDPNAGESGAITDTLVRGLDTNGETSYTISAGLAVNERVLRAIGDLSGGTILVVEKFPTSAAEAAYNQEHGGNPVSLVRVSPSTDTATWRYPVGTSFNARPNSVALAPDGILFGLRARGTELFALDGETGLQQFQLTVPGSVLRYRSPECPQLDQDLPLNGRMSAPRIDGTGTAAFIVTNLETTDTLTALPNDGCAIVNHVIASTRVTVLLYRVTTSGVVQVTPLEEYLGGHSVDVGEDGFGATLPGDDGGVLATWGSCHNVANQDVCQRRGRYVTASAAAMFNLSEPVVGFVPPPPSISAPGLIGTESAVRSTW